MKFKQQEIAKFNRIDKNRLNENEFHQYERCKIALKAKNTNLLKTNSYIRLVFLVNFSELLVILKR